MAAKHADPRTAHLLDDRRMSAKGARGRHRKDAIDARNRSQAEDARGVLKAGKHAAGSAARAAAAPQAADARAVGKRGAAGTAPSLSGKHAADVRFAPGTAPDARADSAAANVRRTAVDAASAHARASQDAIRAAGEVSPSATAKISRASHAGANRLESRYAASHAASQREAGAGVLSRAGAGEKGTSAAAHAFETASRTESARAGEPDLAAVSTDAPSTELSVESSAERAPSAESTSASVAKSTLLMSVATLGSRATGLIRTWAMAFALGNTFITSAYQVANNLPNLIYELVAGGLLAAAFIPVYLLQKEKLGTEGGNKFACNILNIAIIVLGVLAVLATVFAPSVIATQTFTVDAQDDVTRYAVDFFRIFAAQIVFYGIGGVVTGILNANRVYFLPSLAPALNNVVVIASFFAYIPLSAANPELALTVLAVGTTLGVVAQFAIQIPALAKLGFKWRPRINLRDPALIEAVKIALPTLIYIVGTMVSFSCRNAFSLQAGENGPSTLLYAWTWYQLPYGVVAVSLSRALFTEMSEAVARDDMRGFRHHARSGIANTLLLIIPLAALIGVLSTPLMQLFRAGAFDAQAVSEVAAILSLWVVSLPFYSVLMYLYNAFASLRKFMTFAIVSTVMVVVQCGLYAVLCNPDILGLAGVPVADLVYYAVSCVILLFVLRRMVGSLSWGALLWSVVRICIATAIGSAAAFGLCTVLPLEMYGIFGSFGELCISGIVGLAVIFGLCFALRVPEMAFAKRILQRFRR